MNAKKKIDNCHQNTSNSNEKDGCVEWKLAFIEYGVNCFDADECILGNHDCGKTAQ